MEGERDGAAGQVRLGARQFVYHALDARLLQDLPGRISLWGLAEFEDVAGWVPLPARRPAGDGPSRAPGKQVYDIRHTRLTKWLNDGILPHAGRRQRARASGHLRAVRRGTAY